MEEEIIEAYICFVNDFRRRSAAHIPPRLVTHTPQFLQQQYSLYYQRRNCFQVIRHECTNECSYTERGHVYICRYSGNLHYCSVDHCDQMLQTRENRVCRLTATVYPLELEDSVFGEHKNSDSSYKYSAPISTAAALSLMLPSPTPVPVVQLPAAIELPDAVAVAQKHRVATPVKVPLRNTTYSGSWQTRTYSITSKVKKLPGPVHAHQSASANQRRRLPRVANIKAIVPELGELPNLFSRFIREFYAFFYPAPAEVPVSDALLNAVRDICYTLWIVAVGSKHYQEHAFTYRWEYHVMVVLYNMLDGFSLEVNGPVLIPQSDRIRETLPNIKKIKRFHRKIKDACMKARWYTNTERALRGIIQTANPEQLQRYLVQLQRNPLPLE